MNLKTTLQNIDKTKKGFFNIRVNGRLILTNFVKVYCFKKDFHSYYRAVISETIKIIERKNY